MQRLLATACSPKHVVSSPPDPHRQCPPLHLALHQDHNPRPCLLPAPSHDLAHGRLPPRCRYQTQQRGAEASLCAATQAFARAWGVGGVVRVDVRACRKAWSTLDGLPAPSGVRGCWLERVRAGLVATAPPLVAKRPLGEIAARARRQHLVPGSCCKCCTRESQPAQEAAPARRQLRGARRAHTARCACVARI